MERSQPLTLAQRAQRHRDQKTDAGMPSDAQFDRTLRVAFFNHLEDPAVLNVIAAARNSLVGTFSMSGVNSAIAKHSAKHSEYVR